VEEDVDTGHTSSEIFRVRGGQYQPQLQAPTGQVGILAAGGGQRVDRRYRTKNNSGQSGGRAAQEIGGVKDFTLKGATHTIQAHDTPSGIGRGGSRLGLCNSVASGIVAGTEVDTGKFGTV
jgi:hypothetical protein